jgi:hypothetical protein
MPGVDFEELRHTVTIQEVLDLVGFTAVTRSDPQMKGPCPVHGSSNKTSASSSLKTGVGES